MWERRPKWKPLSCRCFLSYRGICGRHLYMHRQHAVSYTPPPTPRYFFVQLVCVGRRHRSHHDVCTGDQGMNDQSGINRHEDRKTSIVYELSNMPAMSAVDFRCIGYLRFQSLSEGNKFHPKKSKFLRCRVL